MPASISARDEAEALAYLQKTGDAHPYVGKVDAAAETVHPEPTLAQREAGNHRMGHVRMHGLDITIEVAKGHQRKGVGHDGKAWSREMLCHYGYVKRTEGADGDHVDVYVGPNPESEVVYIVKQVKRSGDFDENKCMLGFTNRAAARDMYLKHVPAHCLGSISSMTIEQFKQWVKEHANKPVKKAGLSSAGLKVAGLFWPAVSLGGLVTDVAGLRALATTPKPTPDPGMQIMEDRSYLDQLRGVDEKKDKKKKPPLSPPAAPMMGIDPTAKIAEYYRKAFRPSIHRPTWQD